MVKEKNSNRVEAGKKSACKNRWINELKKTMKKEKISYKQAMKLVSQKKKTKNENELKSSSKKKLKENHQESQLSHK